MQLTPNRKRILEAILFLIQEGERIGDPVTQYEIVKSLFLADMEHLEQYGRPITFDNYAALEFGPVPVRSYDFLKPDYNGQIDFPNEAWPPWTLEHARAKAYFYRGPKRNPNLRLLSETDVAALSAALEEVKDLKFGGVVDKTHKNPAYVAAWGRRGDKRSAPIDYMQLMAEPDPELLSNLIDASRCV